MKAILFVYSFDYRDHFTDYLANNIAVTLLYPQVKACKCHYERTPILDKRILFSDVVKSAQSIENAYS